MQRGLFVCVSLCNGSKLVLLLDLHSRFSTNLAPASSKPVSPYVSTNFQHHAGTCWIQATMDQEHVCTSTVTNAKTDKGKTAQGHRACQEYGQQDICLALVPRSEGLMALPLITTSVTRIVREDFHAEGRESMIFCEM